MRILADEDVAGPLVTWLRSEGHDLIWMAEVGPGADDASVIGRAMEQDRVILTQDRDFGELVFRGTQRLAGVIYLRLATRNVAELVAAFRALWPRIEPRAPGHLVVVARGRLRVRPLPA